MLNFAAIVPHPAILIPSVGKENIAKLEKTKRGMEDLAKKISNARLDTLVIVSSHAEMHLEAFSILFSPQYRTDFSEFGDLATKLDFFPDQEIIEKIRHRALDAEISFTLIHGEKLDWSFSVPLFYLAKNTKIKIVPFLHNFTEAKEHFAMGQLVKKTILESNKRIGVIASGNLSHKSAETSPAGFLPKGKEFNEKIKELIETKNAAGILSIDKKYAAAAEECILSPLAVLLGILDKVNYNPEIYSFESPLGVGHMVCNMKLA